MSEDRNLPAVHEQIGDLSQDIGVGSLPPSLQILLNEGLYQRMKQLATLMSHAEGFTPRHLIDKGEACFAIINTALDWKLNPHFVARHTYQTPGGQIGFDGALVQGVLEKSGRFLGAPKMEYVGDWQRVTGKFEKQTSQKGHDYVVGTWTDADALGLGIIVRWAVRGEPEPRVWPGEDAPFWLTQCYPRNSPLWATDPKTQIAYLAIRRFANLVAPGILGAASFDYDDLVMAGDLARDVTPPPKPQREDFADPINRPLPDDPEAWFLIVDGAGQAKEFEHPVDAVEAVLRAMSDALRSRGAAGLEAVWESNEGVLVELRQRDLGHLAENVEAHHAALLAEARQSSASADDPSKGAEGDASASSASSLSEPPAKRHRATKAEMAERREREGYGYHAFKEGRPASVCTYPLNSSEREDWHRGWTKAFSEQIPKRAADADPATKPPEAQAPKQALDGAGSASESNARQSAPVDARPDGPVRLETRANPESAGEAGGSPAPGPTDLVGQLTAKLTAAAEQGIREFHKAWLGLSAHERDLARPMRARYEEIAQGVRT